MNFFKDRENWTQKTILNKDTGKYYNEYYFKRKKALRIPLKTKLAIRLGGYALIEKDLRTIQYWLKKTKELQPRKVLPNKSGFHILSDDQENDEIIKALFLSALVFYGKCFTACKGRRVKLEKINIAPEYHDTHDNVMTLRHNYAAHSGDEKIESVNVVLVLNPKKKYRNESPALVRELIQPECMYPSPNNEHDFYNLVEHMRDFTLKKLEELNLLVFEKDINPKGIEYWYNKAKCS